jgi:hypothetical protein
MRISACSCISSWTPLRIAANFNIRQQLEAPFCFKADLAQLSGRLMPNAGLSCYFSEIGRHCETFSAANASEDSQMFGIKKRVRA